MFALYLLTPNGPQALPWPSSAASLDDATRSLPAGFYTTFRTYDHKRRVLGLRRHLRRLYAFLPGPPPLRPRQLRFGLHAALDAFPADEARVRLIMVPATGCYALLEPLHLPPPAVYEQGVATITVDLRRPRPHEKRTEFVQARAALQAQLQALGAYEALLAPWGRIREGLTSNFFWVRDGTLYTAKWGVLPGVTRATVLRLARARAIPTRYRALPVAEVPTLAEAFITSSSRGIVPVVRIDAHTVGPARPGPLTRALMQDYAAYVARAAEPIVPSR